MQSPFVTDTTPELLEHIVQTDLMGTMWGCETMSKPMMNRTSDSTRCIINVVSIMARKGRAGAVAYAASKAGVLGMTRTTLTKGLC